MREVIANRPEAKDPADKDLVFLIRFRTPWVKIETAEKDGQLQVRCDDAISKESAKLLASLKMKRRGLSFYALRNGTLRRLLQFLGETSNLFHDYSDRFDCFFNH